MKVKVTSVLLLVVGVALAKPQSPPKPPRGQCPLPKGSGIGICQFKPGTNCIGDDECTGSKICCQDGCNKICSEPMYPDRNVDNNMDVCPPTGIPSIGPCVFDPKVNCIDNSECSSGQVCCNIGCNKICKAPLPRPPYNSQQRPQILPPRPPTLPPQETYDKCPYTPPKFGACVFNPDLNCLSDESCSNGQICCNDGCNKICMPPRQETKSQQCPAQSGSGIGICVFNPDVNCVDNSLCKNGKICCPGGCNNVCVDPEPVSVHPASKP